MVLLCLIVIMFLMITIGVCVKEVLFLADSVRDLSHRVWKLELKVIHNIDCKD